jgi:hypothetical protein
MATVVLKDMFQPNVKYRTEVSQIRSTAIDRGAVLPLDRTVGASLGVGGCAIGGCDIGGCGAGDVGGCGSGVV